MAVQQAQGQPYKYTLLFLMRYFVILEVLFGCHIEAAEQQRALNFELVVSDQLFSVILVAYN